MHLSMADRAICGADWPTLASEVPSKSSLLQFSSSRSDVSGSEADAFGAHGMGKRGEGDCISRLEVCVCTALSRAQDFGQEGSGLPMKSDEIR